VVRQRSAKPRTPVQFRFAPPIRENGWELVEKSWDPFGPGWFGEKDSRIYQIVYRDERGNLHKAHVKTSLLSGVYLTNDTIVEHAEPVKMQAEVALEEENRRLRDRIRELESQGRTV
jgi:hypothetical protein